MFRMLHNHRHKKLAKQLVPSEMAFVLATGRLDTIALFVGQDYETLGARPQV